jgi:flagellar biosynthesis/type III secretory pathway protein FliH
MAPLCTRSGIYAAAREAYRIAIQLGYTEAEALRQQQEEFNRLFDRVGGYEGWEELPQQ